MINVYLIIKYINKYNENTQILAAWYFRKYHISEELFFGDFRIYQEEKHVIRNKI